MASDEVREKKSCPHFAGITVKWGIAANKKWCNQCKQLAQLKIDWSGHP